MAAHEHLNPQLFHGSWKGDLKPGDLIHPTPEFISDPTLTAHATPNSAWAAMYGRVYEVEPTDHQQTYNWGDTEGLGEEWVSTAPLRIIKRREDLDASPEYYKSIGKFDDDAIARYEAQWGQVDKEQS